MCATPVVKTMHGTRATDTWFTAIVCSREPAGGLLRRSAVRRTNDVGAGSPRRGPMPLTAALAARATRRRIGGTIRLVLAVGITCGSLTPSPMYGQGRGLPNWVESSWWARRHVGTPWALKNVNVVDVHTGRLTRATIVIQGDRISQIVEHPPATIDGIDAEGLYALPGLFDLHAHVLPTGGRTRAPPPESTLARLLDAGVTTIRLLPLYSESAQLWSARISHGDLRGPTIVPASLLFERVPERSTVGFGTPAEARAWVRREALLGTRWIKVYNQMDSTSLAVIVEEAGRYGMRVGGHARGVPSATAARLGMASIEHITDIAGSCIAADTADAPRGMLARTGWMWSNVDHRSCAALMDTLRAWGTAWVPTLAVAEQIVRRSGHEGAGFASEVERERFRAALATAARLAVEFHRRSGLVGVGTDTPIDGVEPGASVHREIELLVELGGATPLEALQIATIGSARILGFEALLGSIEEGKLAHIVLLGENPLTDPTSLRDVRLVVHDGRVHRPRSP